ncbi:AcrR family transcriptional regulator [Friedmanniella endophytica]|uniref:AcrR family transcriptional regulator n=1 Tax=Microlunatus kandeliicorticis TaxID=1759536 RepID=A0A7W3IQD3_9ACTN|nr:TetR/AcrR family transcriptional regulator [Microlunatus kandeliicorticis]MBA8793323.1 AcrR family transcriptional regulator [Microlunatus kandeliicorticis]
MKGPQEDGAGAHGGSPDGAADRDGGEAGRAVGGERERLLDLVVAHARNNGLAEQSLRRIADAVGSSHRMLLYHFGSRDGLIAAVAERGGDHLSRSSHELTVQGLDELEDRGDFLDVWRETEDRLASDGPLMLELWVRAMTGESVDEPDHSVGADLAPLRSFWVQHGYPEPVAEDLAAVQVAIGRGLVLDRLLGGTHEDLGRLVSWYARLLHPDRPAVRALIRLHPETDDRARLSAGRRPVAPTSRPAVSVRQQLLDALIANAGGSGFGRLSLRRLAAAAGSSHRMLIYHFGSREGVLAALVERIESHQAADLDVLVDRHPGGDPNDAAFGDLWNRILRRLDGSGPLVFELALLAVHGEQPVKQIRGLVIDSYAGPLARFWSTQGLDERAAGLAGRLHVALARGLMIDYLVRGDGPLTHAAFGKFNRLLLATVDEPMPLD